MNSVGFNRYHLLSIIATILLVLNLIALASGCVPYAGSDEQIQADAVKYELVTVDGMECVWRSTGSGAQSNARGGLSCNWSGVAWHHIEVE